MKFILHICRLIVGNLFIFSGIVKVNDPLGFSYKLEEYFHEFGMHWEWLGEMLVPLAAILCIVEIILGIAVLVGYRMQIVSWLLLLMIIFFTILTFASAVFEIVRSCGCFGDAIPLTPWESFMKDVVLLILIIVLFIKRNAIEPFTKPTWDWVYLIISAAAMLMLSLMLDWFAPLIFTVVALGIGVALKYGIDRFKAALAAVGVSLLGSVFMAVWAVEHLPFKDFRPYAVGKNLPQQMTLPEDAQPPVYENLLTYRNKNTGEVKTMNTKEYTQSKIWEDKSWEWENTESKLIKEGDVAKITDLSIINHTGEDITDQVLNMQRVLWIIAYDLDLSDTEAWEEVNRLAREAKQKGITVMGLSSAGEARKNRTIEKYGLEFDFMITDGIVLKTIVRSNPGVVYLENGTVKGKWHANDVPQVSELK
jgi:uncharacterized membrane protein YphA (DoxX/SURF4 family)